MKIDKSLLSGTTPLLILSLLRDGDKYGYQMITDLALRSEHIFELREGTLYPILHALEKDGALRSYEKQTPAGKTRRYYTLTGAGEKRLSERETQWRQFTGAVERVLRAEPSQA
ncbi:MAG: PadR family transcriptional regulator [Clostridium sp. SCN 57-10]|nr:MAG: PadR family transcriptional regulator [Clostridium sp. SCN 57-10]